MNLKPRPRGALFYLVRASPSSYDGQNRLTRSVDTGWSGTRNFSYDSRGNVITAGQLQFTYDSSEQPVAIAGTANGIGSASGSYRYDGHFKRVKQQVNGRTTYSVYDRAGALVHLDAATAGEQTDYIAGPQGTLARIKNNVVTYLHHDILGSAQSGTNSSGVVQWREQYSPFGEELQGINANTDQVGYTGHVRDAATGLSYMQARYYDPVIGRFYSNDPVDMLGHMQRGNSPANGFNRYAYANNNPYKYVDPDGEFGIIGALIGGGIEAAIQLGTEGKISDWKAVGIAGAVGAVTGGVGGRLTTQALKGTMSGARATARTAQMGAAANATGTVISNAIDGEGTSLTESLVSAGGGALGAGAGGKLANRMATKLDDLARSGAPGAANISSATTSSFAINSGEASSSLGTTVGSAAAEAASNLTQRKLNEPKE